jgi:hypothetical protein
MSLAFCLLVFSSVSYAQQPKTNARLVPGSADVIHDVMGIAIGMACDEALAVAARISAMPTGPGRFPYGWQKQTGVARLDGVRIEYPYTRYNVTLKLARNMGVDLAGFSCLEDGDRREVFDLLRRINFESGTETPPSIGSLRALFQEKYGVPSATFDPLSFATIFNRRGMIQSTAKSCVSYENGHLYHNAFLPFDADKCSYALTFTAGQRANVVTGIEINVHDYLRLENGVRAIVANRLQSTPVATPKL